MNTHLLVRSHSGLVLIFILMLVVLSGCAKQEGKQEGSEQPVPGQACAAIPNDSSVVSTLSEPEVAVESSTIVKAAPVISVALSYTPKPAPTHAVSTTPTPAPTHVVSTIPKPASTFAVSTSPTPDLTQEISSIPEPEPTEEISYIPEPTPTQPTSVPDSLPPPDLSDVITDTVEEQVNLTGAKHIDLVLCLDVSGSMDLLIEAAKKKFVEIARDIRNMKGKPSLRIALITYGSVYYNPNRGWVRLESDFTDNVNTVYKKLLPLRADGENEYIARVIQVAVNNLHWSQESDTLRSIFIAGNESIYQDPAIDISDICRVAREKGILINPIYCAHLVDLSKDEWEKLAVLGGGKFASIDLEGGMFGVNIPNMPFPMPTGMPKKFPVNFPVNIPIKIPIHVP